MSATEKEPRLLLELAGDARGPVELPRSGVLSIGADRERVDFLVEGQGVSPVHCAIGRVKGGGWALKDLGSEYGVLVNGERVSSRKLEPGDLIVLGSRRMRIFDPDAARSAPSAPASSPAASPSASAGKAAARSASATPASVEPARSEPSLPQVKGYRVERLLGRGGMGEVYLAVQESLGRPVALKVLSAKLAADQDFVLRFQAEARAAAALNHPNVVTVHDVWEEGGRHFLAMEFMDRGNLEARLARGGKLPVKEALEVLSDAAKALVYAEMRGIVHRDIKPANLMQNSAGATKLADLGLAMHLEAEATESDNKKIFGTPHFISPEQARGEKTDVRSDMYSLGATLYRLLSGLTPFEGATTRDILRGHFLDQPKPLGELVPDLPPALVALVERLLRKKPDERYPSAKVLLDEIERLKSATLHGGSGAMTAPTSGGRSGMLIAVGAVLALGAGAAWWFTRTDGQTNAEPRERDPLVSEPDDIESPTDTHNEPSATDAPTTPDNNPTRPVDDDTALKLRENEAEIAYLKLPRDLSPAERRDALVELTQRFAGTTAAGRYQLEAEELARALEQQNAAEQQVSAAVEAWITSARAALGSSDAPKPLGEALRALLALDTPPDLSTDTAFLARRRALTSAAVSAAINACRAALKTADALESKGDFDGVGATLRPWLVALDLPQMPPELGFDAVPELGDVIGLRGLVQKRVDGLEAARERFATRRTRGDLEALANALRGESGLEGALAGLDLRAADQRLQNLESTLGTEPAKEWTRALRSALTDGRGALDALAREFDAGGWRRKAVPDPRARGRANRDAVGASAEGLLLKADGGSELAPWSAFGARPADLHQLFFQRLSREYTESELRGIEALVRCAAVVSAVREVADCFDATNPGLLSVEEAQAVSDAFDAARNWAAGGADKDAIEREAAAAALLIESLRAREQGQWSVATVRFEELFARHGDTLFVRLLSDGRGAEAAATGR